MTFAGATLNGASAQAHMISYSGKCPNCGKEFFATLKDSSRRKKRFCSRSCSKTGKFNPAFGKPLNEKQMATISKRGPEHHNWRGGIEKAGRGYLVLHTPGEKKVKRLHRVIMEKIIGRPLKEKEVVHHWNCKTNDNSVDNLCLFRTHSSHARLHMFARNHGIKIEEMKFKQPWLIQ